mgnify:CR=1 FL=1
MRLFKVLGWSAAALTIGFSSVSAAKSSAEEIASLGGDITPFLTPDVKRALMEKYGK